MDLMKWLNSLDELLYEVMSWLLFFPLTVWRSLVHPLRTMADVERQTDLPEPEQYAAVLSPPLFLALALLLAHLVSVALGEPDALVADRRGLAGLVDSDTSALVLRTIVFAAFALFLAARLVRARRQPLERGTLRGPFFEQCYPTAVFTLGLSVGTSLALTQQRTLHLVGGLLIAAATLNYVVVETRWFRRMLGCSLPRALGSVAAALVAGIAFLLFVGVLLAR